MGGRERLLPVHRPGHARRLPHAATDGWLERSSSGTGSRATACSTSRCRRRRSRPTIEGLGAAGLDRSSGWTRLVIEKPFGRDLRERGRARRRGAPVVRRVAGLPDRPLPGQGDRAEPARLPLRQRDLRVALEPRPRGSVEITIAEDIGIEGRAGYYESAGLVRDILQNHGTQLLSLVAMGVPARMDAESHPRREGEGAALHLAHPARGGRVRPVRARDA